MEKVDTDGGSAASHSQRIGIEHVGAAAEENKGGDDSATPVSWCSFWRRGLLWDYACTLAVYVLMIILSTQLTPSVRFIPNLATAATIDELRKLDTFIAYPLIPDTVPTWAVVILIVVPLPLLAAVLIWAKKQRSLLEFHAAFMVIFQGCAIQLFFVEVSKVVAGRYRPDFLSRCTAISSAGVCESSNASQAADGRKSFPSGHASSSFFGVLAVAMSTKRVMAIS
jgi:membrane-associated phospholipid phosphatase